jgi:hypothetical protein
MNGRAQNFGTFHPPPHPPAQQFLVGQSLHITEAALSPSDAPQFVGLLWTSDQPDTDLYLKTQHSPETDVLSERPQTHVLHGEATGIDNFRNFRNGTLVFGH